MVNGYIAIDPNVLFNPIRLFRTIIKLLTTYTCEALEPSTVVKMHQSNHLLIENNKSNPQREIVPKPGS